jgi:Domain of unknown function (DUF6438)
MGCKYRYIFPAVALAALLYVSAAAQTQLPKLESLTPDQIKSLVISFERTSCYGNCPAYKLTIHGDGRVEYVGARDVKVVGSKSGSVEDAGLRSILAAFSAAAFTSIGEDVSESKCSCNTCTDFPSVITAITVGKATYRVNHYHGCACASKELLNLEDEIDRIVRSDQWTGDISKAGPVGTTCFAPRPAKSK